MGDGIEIEMGGKCVFYETCGFIQNYKGSGQYLKEGWVSMFCDEFESSENCKRKRMILEVHKHPADNMTPTGKLLD
jgi:hypothetical protein